MLPDLRHQLAPELQDLQYSAQEVVCQICSAYRERESSEARHSLNAQRRRLNTIATRLAALKKGLTNEQKLLAAAEEIRSIHRPLGAPGSVSEVMHFLGGGDYFASQKEYFEKTNRADPAEPLDKLAKNLATARHFLDQEIAFVQSKIQSIKAPWKVRPHLWWQAGGIYYLLDRIFREASVKPTTQADAHRKIIEIMRKVDHRVLTFDLSKGYCPAICTAIERMSSDYKQLCDQHLQEWLDLTLRQR